MRTRDLDIKPALPNDARQYSEGLTAQVSNGDNQGVADGLDEQVPPELALELIMHQVDLEHGLISNRLLWYVTSQSFLLAAFAGWVWNGNGNHWTWVPEYGLPWLGIVTSVFIVPILVGGAITMHKWILLLRELIPAKSNLGRIVYVKRPRWIHAFGLVVPNLFPLAFAGLWIAILLKR